MEVLKTRPEIYGGMIHKEEIHRVMIHKAGDIWRYDTQGGDTWRYDTQILYMKEWYTRRFMKG